jgi:ribose transport system substrate-binding protein
LEEEMKHNKKFIFIVMLVMLAVLVLSACTTPTAEVKPVETKVEATVEVKPAETQEKYTIGVSLQGTNNTWASASYAAFKYGFEAYKDKIKNLYYAECGYDVQKQISDIEDLLTKNIDVLVVQSTSETALVSVVEKAKEMGVKVIIYGGSVGTDVYDAYIDRDHGMTGTKYAEYVVDRIGGKGNVVVIMGYPGSGYSNAVLGGVNGVLSKYPDVKVLGVEYAEYTPALSKQIIEAYFAKGEQIDGVIVDGGLMGFGVLEAFTDAGKTIPPTTCDDTFLYLKKAVSLDFTNYLCLSSGEELSYDAVKLVFDVAEGKSFKKDNILPPQSITGEEVLKTIDTTLPDSYWLFSTIPTARISEFFK